MCAINGVSIRERLTKWLLNWIEYEERSLMPFKIFYWFENSQIFHLNLPGCPHVRHHIVGELLLLQLVDDRPVSVLDKRRSDKRMGHWKKWEKEISSIFFITGRNIADSGCRLNKSMTFPTNSPQVSLPLSLSRLCRYSAHCPCFSPIYQYTLMSTNVCLLNRSQNYYVQRNGK